MDNIMIYPINIWTIEKEYKNNLIEEDIIYDMIIGQYDIYPFAYPIIKTISKNIYNKLITKEYVLEERLDLEELFLIKDQNGNYISSVNGVELPKSIKKESKIKKLFKKLKL
ncbi:MAG: hypothetical protein ACLUGB_04755 [Bacilli bacterium]|jgi:hypothetical protein